MNRHSQLRAALADATRPAAPHGGNRWLGCLRWMALGWLLACPALHAQTAGRVDPSFGVSLGTAGKVYAVSALANGTTLVGGSFLRGIVRLNADGTTDSTFNAAMGAGGLVQAIAVQTDGKIVIGGSYLNASGAGLARLNADGTLDTTFSANTEVSVICLALQTDGKIVVGCVNTVIRFNSTGTVDTSFSAGAGANANVRSVAVQSDGKILAGGLFTTFEGASLKSLVRLTTTGGIDTSFAPSTIDGGVSAVAVQSDGKILAGVSSTLAFPSALARFTTTGALDTTFATQGAVGAVFGLAVQSDGKIVVGGNFSVQGGNATYSVARFNTTGTRDTAFAPATTDEEVQTVAARTDGKTIVGGNFTAINSTSCDSVARVNADGSLDSTFQLSVPLGLNQTARVVAVQSDGRIIVGGDFTTFSGVSRSHVVRVNVDGTLDTTFNPGVGTDYTAYSLAIQSDGKVIINGDARVTATGSPDTSFVPPAAIGACSTVVIQGDGKILCVSGSVHRLNATGSVDTTFTVPTVSGIYSMALQADGKILIGGAFTTVNGVTHNGLARLNANGTLDTTFNPGGFSVSGCILAGLAVQTDGKIVAVGAFPTFSGANRQCIARINTDGSLDTTFVPGVVGTVGGYVYFRSVAVQSDGKIVVAGDYNASGINQLVVARFNPTGSLDTTLSSPAGTSSSLIFALSLQSDGRIVVVGDFALIGGSVRNYLARLTTSGGVDPTFVPGAGYTSVNSLAFEASDGSVVLGGSFTSVAGQSANALARVHSDGSLDPTFTAPFSAGDSVPALVRQPADGNIVASQVPAAVTVNASLTPLALRPRTQSKVKNPIVRCISINGSVDSTFYAYAGTDGTAYALGLEADTANAGKIVVAGNFTQLNSITGHTNLGRLNADGTLDTGFNASANATVQTVFIQADGNLVVGGIFTQVDGAAHARLARLNAADGTLDAGFSTAAGTDGPVAALKQQSDGRLVVGGSFAAANGVAHSCLARLNADGTLDTTFNAGTISLSGGTALVSSIDQQTDGKLIVGGLFDHIGSTARPNVARLNTDGSVDTTFDPGGGPDAVVRALVLQPDGKTLLGGDFSTVSGLQRDAAARLLGDYDLNSYPPLGQWRIINFNQSANTGNAADTAAPYGDGVPNLVKYALNLNPQGADATPMTAMGTKGLPLLGKDTTGHYLTLTFVRRQAATAPGVTYLVEFTNSLANPAGFAVNSAATSSVTTIDATWQRVVVTDSVPISTQAPGRFIRLHITDP